MQTNPHDSSDVLSDPETASLAAESSRVAPLLLILAAWMSGMLLVQLSSLDEHRSRSASEHWGRPANAWQQWHERERELAVLPGSLAAWKGRAAQGALKSGTAVQTAAPPANETMIAAAEPQVVVAGATVELTSPGEPVRLSSHQRDISEPRKHGLQLPLLYAPAEDTVRP